MGFSPPVAVSVPFRVAVDATGVIFGETVSLALTSPSVGAVKPAKVAKVPAELVHFNDPPTLDTARR